MTRFSRRACLSGRGSGLANYTGGSWTDQTNHPDHSLSSCKSNWLIVRTKVYQLMAEVLYVHFLHIWHTTMGENAKVERINQVLEWSNRAMVMPEHLLDSLTQGIGASMSFNLLRPYHVGFLIEFVEQWKAQAQDKRASLLDDPWAFKDFVTGMSFNSLLLTNNRDTPNTQREALLHLVFPDDFEGIVSSDWKNKIANADAFARFVTEPTDDVDRKIQQIRMGLEIEYRKDFDFSDDDIRIMWGPADAKLGYIRQACPSSVRRR